MRVITPYQERNWRSGRQSSHVKVIIDGVDITNLEGHNWFHGGAINEGNDMPVATAELEIHRDYGRLSLSPFRDDSKLNQGGVIIDESKPMQIWSAVLPADISPVVADYMLVYSGIIDSFNFGTTPGKIKSRDKGHLLADTMIKTIRVYGSPTGTPLETIIQNILDDNINTPGLGSVTLFSVNGTPGTPFIPGESPGYDLLTFYQSKQSVFEAIRTLTTEIGWEIKYKFNSNTGDFEFTLFEPPRSKTTPDFSFNSRNEYRDFREFEVSRLGVRNSFKGVFTDISGVEMTGAPDLTFAENFPSPDTITRSAGSWITDGFLGNQRIKIVGSALNDGEYQIDTVSATVLTLKEDEDLQNEGPVSGVTITTGLRTTIIVIDQASIDKRGELYMELTEGSSSQINTVTVMERYLNGAKGDLSEPTAIAGVVMPYFPWAETSPGDLWGFAANGVHFNTDQAFAPDKITHRFDGSGDAKTTGSLRGKVSGGRLRWFEREGGRHVAAAIDDKQDVAPANVATQASAQTVISTFDDPRVTEPKMVDWAYTEVYLDTTPGFTPSFATLVKRIRDTRIELSGLVPGQTYYLKLIHVDRQGNRSQISAQVVETAQEVAAYHTNNETEVIAVNRNPSFGQFTFPEASNPPDAWFPDPISGSGASWGSGPGQWWWSSAIQLTGNRSVVFNAEPVPGGGGTFNRYFVSEAFLVAEARVYQASFAFQHAGDGGPNNQVWIQPVVTFAQSDKVFPGVFTQLRSTVYGWEAGPVTIPPNTWISDRGYFTTPLGFGLKYAQIGLWVTVTSIGFLDPSHPTTYTDRLTVVRSLAKLEKKPTVLTIRSVPQNTWVQPWLQASAEFDNAASFTPGVVGVNAGFYTIPTDGEYYVSGQVFLPTLTSARRMVCRIQRNGIDLVIGPSSGTAAGLQPFAAAMAGPVQLIRGDVITLWVLHNDPVTRSVDDNGSFLLITQLTDIDGSS